MSIDNNSKIEYNCCKEVIKLTDKLLLEASIEPTSSWNTIILIVIVVSIVWFLIKKYDVIEKFKMYRDPYDYAVGDMEELSELYKNGEITKEEYDKRKKDIINKL